MQWTSNATLTISNLGSVLVENGATITRNGTANAVMIASDGAIITVDDSGSGIDVSDLEALGDLTLNGTGTITIDDDLLIRNPDNTIVNNISGIVSISDRFHFTNAATTNTWTNNGNMLIGGDLRLNSSNCLFDNNGQVQVGDDILIPSSGDISNIVNNNSLIFSIDYYQQLKRWTASEYGKHQWGQ